MNQSSHLYFTIQSEMATNKLLVLTLCLFSCSVLNATEQSLESLLSETTQAVQHAKRHIEHMLALPSHQDHQKIVDSVKNACDHFYSELESHSYELQSKASGNHNEGLAQAAHSAAEHFNNSANSLRGLSGSDLKQQNDEYFKAADVVLREAKNIIAANPCDEIAPIVRGALTELKQDCDHYQDLVHSAVGDHSPLPETDGHHEHHDHGHGHGHDHSGNTDFSHASSSGHHVHQNHHHHHGKSSEESSEEKH